MSAYINILNLDMNKDTPKTMKEKSMALDISQFKYNLGLSSLIRHTNANI